MARPSASGIYEHPDVVPVTQCQHPAPVCLPLRSLLVPAGLCRAHGIPHQSVTTPQELPSALATAWGINRHSVVEVITDR